MNRHGAFEKFPEPVRTMVKENGRTVGELMAEVPVFGRERSVQDISANTSDPRNRKPGGTARYRRPSWKGDSQKRSLNDLRRGTLSAHRKTPGFQSTSPRFSLEALILLTRTES